MCCWTYTSLAGLSEKTWQICGAEAFGCAETYRHFHKKLVQSYALDALDKDVLDENEKEGISVHRQKPKTFWRPSWKQPARDTRPSVWEIRLQLNPKPRLDRPWFMTKRLFIWLYSGRLPEENQKITCSKGSPGGDGFMTKCSYS